MNAVGYVQINLLSQRDKLESQMRTLICPYVARSLLCFPFISYFNSKNVIIIKIFVKYIRSISEILESLL